jgi:hypothetical protein
VLDLGQRSTTPTIESSMGEDTQGITLDVAIIRKGQRLL